MQLTNTRSHSPLLCIVLQQGLELLPVQAAPKELDMSRATDVADESKNDRHAAAGVDSEDGSEPGLCDDSSPPARISSSTSGSCVHDRNYHIYICISQFFVCAIFQPTSPLPIEFRHTNHHSVQRSFVSTFHSLIPVLSRYVSG